MDMVLVIAPIPSEGFIDFRLILYFVCMRKKVKFI